MSAGSKTAWDGILGLTILFSAHLVCLDALSAAPGAAASDDNSNPYSVISARNVFRLNQPPASPNPNNGQAFVLPVVYLSGFMHAGGQWKALLVVKSQNPDPRGFGLTSYLTLAEGDKKTVGSGEKQAVVELARIYSDQEKIDIVNSGTSMTLSMKDNGFDSKAAALGGRGESAIRLISGPAVPMLAAPSATAVAPADGANSGRDGSAVVGLPPSIGGNLSPNRDASNMGNNIAGAAPADAANRGDDGSAADGLLPSIGDTPSSSGDASNIRNVIGVGWGRTVR